MARQDVQKLCTPRDRGVSFLRDGGVAVREGQLEVQGLEGFGGNSPFFQKLTVKVFATTLAFELGKRNRTFEISEVSNVQRTMKPYLFNVNVGNTQLQLRCKDEMECVSWVQTLSEAIGEASSDDEGDEEEEDDELASVAEQEEADSDEESEEEGDFTEDSEHGGVELEDKLDEESARQLGTSQIQDVHGDPNRFQVEQMDPIAKQAVKLKFQAAVIGFGKGDVKQNIVKLISKCSPGSMNLDEFMMFVRKSMKVSKESISDNQIVWLFKDLDTDKSNTIVSSELVTWLVEKAAPRKTMVLQKQAEAQYSKKKKAPLEGLVKKLRARIRLVTRGCQPKLIQKFYQDVDKDESGDLDLTELRSLVRNKFKLSQRDVSNALIEDLFHCLDKDSGGTISFEEFNEFIVDEGGQGGVLPEAKRSRLTVLWQMHNAKLEKRQLLNQLQEKAADNEFAVQQMATQHLRTRVYTSLDGMQAATRLYNNFFDAETRKINLKSEIAASKERDLEIRRLNNLPTRSRSSPAVGIMLDACTAANRLHKDAERRGKDKQAAKDAADMAELEELARFQVHAKPTMRHRDLFDDAEARKARLEQRRAEAEHRERANAEAVAVPCGKGRQANPERLSELHAEAAERQRNLARKVAEQKMQELVEFSTMVKGSPPMGAWLGASPPMRRRPSIVDDPRSPRSVRSEARSEREASTSLLTCVKTKKTNQVAGPKRLSLTTQSDHALASIISIITNRCSYATDADSIFDADHRPLIPPLKAAMRVHKDALSNCETSEGYSALCGRASQRLYRERLVPDFEGWGRCIEPDPIRQVEDELEDLLVTANKAQQVLRHAIAGGQDWTPETNRPHPAGVPLALFAYDPGVKREAAAEAKSLVRYGPAEGRNRYRHLLDLSRMLLVFSNCEMLQAGLDQILRRFEVVNVKNFFNVPGRLGVRFVEVLVVVQVGEGDDSIPHICELRLEELCFHKAQQRAAAHLERFMDAFRVLYKRNGRDGDALGHLVRSVLLQPPCSHSLRVFRCHLAKRFGSTVCAWRRQFGGRVRLLNFTKFREVCQKLNCGEHATEFWEALDPSLGGCISMFDLDPEATALLIKLRIRLLALGDVGDSQVQADPESLFARLCFLVRPRQAGQLERQEFLTVATPLGLSKDEANKVFSYLDHHAGISNPAYVTVKDVAWLTRLSSLVDIQAVTMASVDCNSEQTALRHLTWGRTKLSKRCEVLRLSVMADKTGTEVKSDALNANLTDSDDEYSSGTPRTVTPQTLTPRAMSASGGSGNTSEARSPSPSFAAVEARTSDSSPDRSPSSARVKRASAGITAPVISIIEPSEVGEEAEEEVF
jgi:Ca2+-binding EF-hand superfamily protein